MDFDYQILRLTKDFYSAYADHNISGELMLKENRAYNCLLIDLYYDYFLCIPYRTDIRHKNAFKFRKSSRSRTHQSGLDYSKMVIVKNSEYLEAKDAIIDHDEFKETIENITTIVNEANNYLQKYILHVSGKKTLSPEEYDRLFRYSSLQYFHNELGL